MKKIHLVLSVLTLLVVGGLAYCEWTEGSHWSEGRWQSVRHQDRFLTVERHQDQFRVWHVRVMPLSGEVQTSVCPAVLKGEHQLLATCPEGASPVARNRTHTIWLDAGSSRIGYGSHVFVPHEGMLG
ncbi:hypothetical protein LH417_02955 [Laribacter hongkongensis]|uniref:hypothetical protein n=1 Tax=Laribacter hongkongensis TaxID=168471 RepID=UPI001EFC4071|nr:hypothetical protein [Laribacter hongkongensis]MCG9021917.1 hypothetical protein [Laribacter hongkongensis]